MPPRFGLRATFEAEWSEPSGRLCAGRARGVAAHVGGLAADIVERLQAGGVAGVDQALVAAHARAPARAAARLSLLCSCRRALLPLPLLLLLLEGTIRLRERMT